MKRLLPMMRSGRETRGAALVLTMLFVALISVMIVGYFETARMDFSLSASHLEKARAEMLSKEGLQRVVATLQRETVDPAMKPGETLEVYTLRKRHWISQPGALIVPEDPPADQKLLRRVVRLSSGPPQSASYSSKVFNPVNLNIPLLADAGKATHLITDRLEASTNRPAEMLLKWIYVRQDAASQAFEYDFSEEPDLTDTNKPLIGRFAYWADDEGSKINYNLAWKRSHSGSVSYNRNPSSHPSKINLLALTLKDGTPMPESMADALRQWTTTTPGRYFNSFADARQLEAAQPGIADFLSFNKFELTHYNHDPDTTFFGEDRIMLTTNRDLVPKNPDGTFARKFLDIMRDDKEARDCDPGVFEDIQSAQPDWRADPSGKTLVPGRNKFDETVRHLIRYISATDWPLAPGKSFRDKYYPGTPLSDARLGQIAVNIIDYVRAKESAQRVFAPTRFGVDPSGKYTIHPSYAYGGALSLQGLSRAPLITEMGVYVEKDPVESPPQEYRFTWPRDPATGGYLKLYRVHFRTELHLPENYGLEDGGIDLVPDKAASPSATSRGWFMGIPVARDGGYYFPSPNGKMVNMNGKNDPVRIFKSDIQHGEGSDGTVLNAGKYVTVTKTYYRRQPWAENKSVSNRLGLYQDSLGDLDHIILGNLSRWPRIAVVTQQGSLPYAISDPASVSMENMNSLEVDDPRCGMHTNDWKPRTGNSFGAVNAANRVGKPALAVLPQQDADANGHVSDHSLYMPPPKGVGANGPNGDNGRLTSVGELGYVHTGVNARTGSTSWRSIRLQPNNYKEVETLPDWALLDLFSVPNTGEGGSTALYKPHGTSVGGRLNVNSRLEGFPTMTRDRGLAALLTGVNQVGSQANAEVIASNIYNHVLATGSSAGKRYGYPWGTGVSSTSMPAYDTPGEICEIAGVADKGEESENLVREIVSLITARSGVFSVYTVGQSLKQTRSGGIVATSEQRHQFIVERSLKNNGTPSPSDDHVQFRTLYSRQLNP